MLNQTNSDDSPDEAPCIQVRNVQCLRSPEILVNILNVELNRESGPNRVSVVAVEAFEKDKGWAVVRLSSNEGTQ